MPAEIPTVKMKCFWPRWWVTKAPKPLWSSRWLDDSVTSHAVTFFLEDRFFSFLDMIYEHTERAANTSSQILRETVYSSLPRKGVFQLLISQSWSMITPNIFRFFERSRSGVQSRETKVLKSSFSDQHAAPNFRWRWRHNFFSWRQNFLKFFLELLYWVLKPNTEFRQTPLRTFPDIAARNFRLHDEIWKVGQNSYHLKALFTASSMMLAISSFSWFWADKKEKETPKLTLIEWQYDGGWVLSHFALPKYSAKMHLPSPLLNRRVLRVQSSSPGPEVADLRR